MRFNAERGEYGPGDIEKVVAERLELFAGADGSAYQWRRPNGTVLEIRANPMPGGGFATSYSEVTEHVETATQLAAADETLEQRVHERTAELTSLNVELSRAKIAAEEANLGKTRFLAAASHDLLQPLNAARLYVSSLMEQQARARVGDDADRTLVRKLDTSLGAVEEILGALLDISRLDAGRLLPERQDMALGGLFEALRVEFAPLAERKGLDLRILATGLAVNSDRRLLRRILQNLLSNAVRYTPAGKILMGARRRGTQVMIEVHDTGSGIPVEQQNLVFREFQRFAVAPGAEQGLGLGLSIVDRIARVLDHPVGIPLPPRPRHRLHRAAAARPCRRGGQSAARDPDPRAAGARARHHAVHRQRAWRARRDEDAAGGLGLPVSWWPPVSPRRSICSPARPPGPIS